MKIQDRFITSVRGSEASPQGFVELQTFSYPKYYTGDSSQQITAETPFWKYSVQRDLTRRTVYLMIKMHE